MRIINYIDYSYLMEGGPAHSVRMCLRILGIVLGNYLIIEVAGIPLHIGEHTEHFGCNMKINIQLSSFIGGANEHEDY